jgi:predicted dehydrogenase
MLASAHANPTLHPVRRRPAETGGGRLSAPRTALVGIGGYGRVHLRHLLDFQRRGELVLAAAVVFPPEPDTAVVAELRAAGCEILESFEALLAALPRLRVEFAILPTPIHLHARMSIALLRAGVDVLVEKPLAATPADAEAILTAARTGGRRLAVGFQYLHAPEVRSLRRQLEAGAIGALRRLAVHAAWPRSHAYYTRNAWAGRLRVGEDWVLDSPFSNAMSHFLMVMLHLAGGGAAELAQPVRFAAELYRAQAIESFDTAVLHLETAEGVRLDFYGTHSSESIGRPTLHIEGAAGTAEWVQDSHARLRGTAGEWWQEAFPEADTRERMLRDVLAHRRGEPARICSAEMAALHVRCIDELHRNVAITPVPAECLARQQADGQTFTYVPGLDPLFQEAARSGRSLAEMGIAWAVPTPVARPFRPAT